MIWRGCLLVAAVFGLLCGPPHLHGQVVADDPPDDREAEVPFESIPLPPPVAPAPQRVTLGISVAPVTQQAVLQYGLAVRSGALITTIVPGSPADRVGLPLGGVIVAVDGQRVAAPNDLIRIIQTAQPNQKIELKYYQGRQLARKQVQLSPDFVAPANPARRTGSEERPPAAVPPQARWQQNQRPLLGRIGRMIDEFAPQIQGQTPLNNIPGLPPATGQTPLQSIPGLSPTTTPQTLQQQVEELQRQVAVLQQRLAELEQRLAEDDRPELPPVPPPPRP